MTFPMKKYWFWLIIDILLLISNVFWAVSSYQNDEKVWLIFSSVAIAVLLFWLIPEDITNLRNHRKCNNENEEPFL